MKFREFNKATAAAVGGALMTVADAFFVFDAGLMDAMQVIVITALVYLVPNIREATGMGSTK